MKYFVYDNEREGTIYYEFFKDKWELIGKQITDPVGREIYDEASEWLDSVWPEYGCFTIIGI